MKPKSIQNIETRMQGLNPESLRYQVLDSAKNFKSSWIELGQYLSSVYRDKLFKDWGYLTFEAYCAKEVGIRQNTALKLVKSYSFLEKEEPEFLKHEAMEERKPSQIPAFESVNALRLAKASEKLSEKDYEALREDVLESPKEEGEIKKKIRYILKSTAAKKGEGEDPKNEALKKMFFYLQNSRKNMTSLSLPNKIVKKIDELLELLEDYGR